MLNTPKINSTKPKNKFFDCVYFNNQSVIFK